MVKMLIQKPHILPRMHAGMSYLSIQKGNAAAQRAEQQKCLQKSLSPDSHLRFRVHLPPGV